jgi:hypothetical protein
MQLPQANLNSMVSKYHMTLKSHTQEIPGAQSSTLGQAPKDGPKWSLPFTYGCDFVNARDIQVVRLKTWKWNNVSRVAFFLVITTKF